jgi:hypothetical protein
LGFEVRLLAFKAGTLPLEPGLQPTVSTFLKLLNEVGEAPLPLMPAPSDGSTDLRVVLQYEMDRQTTSKLRAWNPNSAESHNAEEREVN